MYLKSLDVIGFKSFADKTHLEFEKGMTAIVGPNGCGKSNISDAIRWVLGEQRARALRGKNMQDCIFTGTDSRKPLGMAEVAITFADCDGMLDTEYNEVTVSRRIFRSGESQYYINKTPSRLKDIQRLFMGTGIGTSSYSFMEQGKIDQILSSRAEDRRIVFEEASGITKYKADKKEALRKLAQTDANLLRLTDVIGEVKRQIGSLQRQAGKARRYKEAREELQSLDVYLSKIKLKELSCKLERYDKQKIELDNAIKAGEQEFAGLEEQHAMLQEELAIRNNEINAVLEEQVQARSDYEHTCELIEINEQRIEEYKELMERDVEEIESLKLQLQTKQSLIVAMKEEIEKSKEERELAEATLNVVNAKFYQHKEQIDSTRQQIHQLRREVVELENMITSTQNQLMAIEAKEREQVIRREKLLADKQQLERNKELFIERVEILGKEVQDLEEQSLAARNSLDEIEGRMEDERARQATLNSEVSKLQSQLAGKRAKLDIFIESESRREGMSNGVKDILDERNPLGIDRASVLGTIAGHIDIESEYVKVAQVALSRWVDAVVVDNYSSAMTLVKALQKAQTGSAKLLNADSAVSQRAIKYDGDKLLDHINADRYVEELLQSILCNVYVVRTVDDLPLNIPVGVVVVSEDGAIASNDFIDFVRASEDKTVNPLLRKQAIETLHREIAVETGEIAEKQKASENSKKVLEELKTIAAQRREELHVIRREHAMKLGAKQSQENEYKEVCRRFDTTLMELEELLEKSDSGDEREQLFDKKEEFSERRERVSVTIEELTQELQTCEVRFSEMQSEVTEQRVAFAQAKQHSDHLVMQHNDLLESVKDISRSISSKEDAILSHKANVTRREAENAKAKEKTELLKIRLNELNEQSQKHKNDRDETNRRMQETDSILAVKRNQLDVLKSERSSVDLKKSEVNMHKEHMIERVTSEYGLTLYEIVELADPEWEGGEPSVEEIESKVSDLKRRLESMGAVNLVAIEEHQQLEERYTFLVEQEEDLVNSKNQLEAMIKKINVTTTEMFRKTFDQINENFEEMYKILFNGGTAKLVMVNDEDILECGIDIIARPPGKKLQNISLLSGGEKTMTAVALMFAIYMIKPSPFCLLDELDAALDDANIGRFISILSRFVEKSQFVIITHNRQTMAASSALYGVTMPEKGVSSIISMRFNEAEKYSQ